MKADLETLFNIDDLQYMVSNIGEMINHNTVIYNHDGIVIAARNKNRIGKFNPGIIRMLDEDGEPVVVESPDNPDDVLPGISLPIIFEGNPVGAIGITGQPDEVSQFVHVIQFLVNYNLSELKDEALASARHSELTSFVYSWLLQSKGDPDTAFSSRSRTMHVDIASDRYIAVIDPCLPSDSAYAVTRLNAQIFRTITTAIHEKNRGNIAAFIDNRIVLLLLEQIDYSEIKELLYKKVGVNVAVGQLTSACKSSDLRTGYEIAGLACDASKKAPEHDIVSYDTYSLDFLLSSIRSDIRKRFVENVFAGQEGEKLRHDAAQLIKNYVEANRSVSACAERMHMHKNTVQYRLEKIHQLTGLDPHNTENLIRLYLASLSVL